MAENTIQALREELFETLRAIKNANAPMDIERARAVNDVAQTIINSAKVEVDAMKVTGSNKGTGFIPLPGPEAPKPGPRVTATGVVEETQTGVVHRMRG